MTDVTEHEEPLYHLRVAIRLADGDEEQVLRDAHNQIVESREEADSDD